MCVATAILCFDECCLLLHWTNNVCVCAKINTNLNDYVDAFWAGPSWPNGRGMPEQLTALQSKRQTFQPLRLTLAGTLLSTETRCLPPLIQTPLTLCLSFFLFFFFPHYSRHTMITSILFVAACPWNHARRITCEPGFSLQSRGARGVELTLPLLHRAVCLLSVGNVVFSGCCVSEMHRIWHGAYLGPNW